MKRVRGVAGLLVLLCATGATGQVTGVTVQPKDVDGMEIIHSATIAKRNGENWCHVYRMTDMESRCRVVICGYANESRPAITCWKK